MSHLINPQRQVSFCFTDHLMTTDRKQLLSNPLNTIYIAKVQHYLQAHIFRISAPDQCVNLHVIDSPKVLKYVMLL